MVMSLPKGPHKKVRCPFIKSKLQWPKRPNMVPRPNQGGESIFHPPPWSIPKAKAYSIAPTPRVVLFGEIGLTQGTSVCNDNKMT